MTNSTYYYSVVTVYPRPWRAECLNLGVILIAPDGTYSQARFGETKRLTILDAGADLPAVRSALRGFTDELPLHGIQTHLSGSRSMSVAKLQEWSETFAGIVRVTPPRAALGSDPEALLRGLFDEQVSTTGRSFARRETSNRRKLLAQLDKTFSGWQLDLPGVWVRASASIRGRRAQHPVDRAYFDHAENVVGLLDVLDFTSADRASIPARRATLVVAAEDVRERPVGMPVSIFALCSEPSGDLDELREETLALLEGRQIKPITPNDMDEFRAALRSGSEQLAAATP